MWKKIIDSPDLAKYHMTYESGQVVFYEGDDSQDLYFLISGQLDIYRGDTKIREITEVGAFFGEMSFLLGGKRTATVKAFDEVRTIRVPKEKVATFLRDFPEFSQEICGLLAQRLDETSQVLYGLKAFCDQAPDAVILTDSQGKIISWNTAAESLYGRDWNQVQDRAVEEIYEDPQLYRDFLEEVRSRRAVRERVLPIRHPDRGVCFISTSTTVLYDGHQNVQGVLSFGRDVTKVKSLERRYRLARNWLLPGVFLLGILVASVFFAISYFSNESPPVKIEKLTLRNQLAKDYLLLNSLLGHPFAAGDQSKTSQLMKAFFQIQDPTVMPYVGLVLLNRDKTVFDVCSAVEERDTAQILDETYAGVSFQGSDDSIHKLLTFYRADDAHPMGDKAIEMAFEWTKDGEFVGWLIFQMNVDSLGTRYGINEEDLKAFRFEKP
jgi:PAS domain S-box-containing protein